MKNMNTMNNLPNPLRSSNDQLQPAATGNLSTEGVRAIEEVRAAMVIAKQFPRDEMAAADRIMQSCQRTTLAEAAVYVYPKGGAQVTGPSIRLAEAMARHWGNLQWGIRELSQSNGESIMEAFCWDVENNSKQVKQFTVPHVRHTRNGQVQLRDPREIYELTANHGARRLRACILAIIPADVTEAAVKQCEMTQANAAQVDADSIKAMVNAFAEVGVSKQMLEARVGHRLTVEATISAELLALRRIWRSIKDGMGTVADYFKATEATKDDELVQKAQKMLKGPETAKKGPESSTKEEGDGGEN
jgi:hypothetical protein